MAFKFTSFKSNDEEEDKKKTSSSKFSFSNFSPKKEEGLTVADRQKELKQGNTDSLKNLGLSEQQIEAFNKKDEPVELSPAKKISIPGVGGFKSKAWNPDTYKSEHPSFTTEEYNKYAERDNQDRYDIFGTLKTELDHKISIALGGLPEDANNLETVKARRTIKDIIKKTPAHQLPEAQRQGENLTQELDIIDRYQSGELSQGQAVAEMNRLKSPEMFEPEKESAFKSVFKERVSGPVKENLTNQFNTVKNFLTKSKTGQYVQSTRNIGDKFSDSIFNRKSKEYKSNLSKYLGGLPQGEEKEEVQNIINVVNSQSNQKINVANGKQDTKINVLDEKQKGSVSVDDKKTTDLNVVDDKNEDNLNVTTGKVSAPRISTLETIERTATAYLLPQIAKGLEISSKAALENFYGYEDDLLGKLYKKLSPGYKYLEKNNEEAKKTALDVINKHILFLDDIQEQLVAPIYDNVEGLSSFNEKLSTIVGGSLSMMEAAGIYYLTKSSAAAAMFLSYFEATDSYQTAREAGKSPQEALNSSFSSLAVTTALETISLNFIFNAGPNLFRNSIGIVKYGVGSVAAGSAESSQEILQTWSQNIITKYGYDDTVKIFDGTWESVVGTFLPAMILGGASIVHYDFVKKQINKQANNLDIKLTVSEVDSMATEIVDLMINTGSKITGENITNAKPIGFIGAKESQETAPLGTIKPKVYKPSGFSTEEQKQEEEIIIKAEKKPQEAYHIPRTKEALKAIKEKGFDLNKFGSKSGTQDMGDPKGVYFFPDEASFKGVEEWADSAKEFGVVKRKLDIQKPLIITSEEQYLIEANKALGTSYKSLNELRNSVNTRASETITKYLQDKGYDSIVDKDGILGFNEPQIIVFNTKSIKGTLKEVKITKKKPAKAVKKTAKAKKTARVKRGVIKKKAVKAKSSSAGKPKKKVVSKEITYEPIKSEVKKEEGLKVIDITTYKNESFSKHYERIKDKYGFDKLGVEIKRITHKGEIRKAYDYIQRQPQRALKIAYNIINNTTNINSQAIRQSLVSIYLEQGKIAQAQDIARIMSAEYTVTSQTLGLANTNLSEDVKIQKAVTDKRKIKIGESLGEFDPKKALEQAKMKVKQGSKELARQTAKEQSEMPKSELAAIDDLIQNLIC